MKVMITVKKYSSAFSPLLFSITIFFSCVHSRPPKPGPDFVWVKPVKGPKGKIIPGHWVYKVAPKPDKNMGKRPL